LVQALVLAGSAAGKGARSSEKIPLQEGLGNYGWFDAAKVGDARMLTALIKHGHNVNEPLRNGRTALHVAAAHGQSEIVRILLDHGAYAKPSNEMVPSALFLACHHGHPHVVDILLRRAKAVPPDDCYPKGDDTALSRAASRGHERIVRLLVSAGADVNQRTGTSATALMRAAAQGHASIVAYLVDHGADPALRNEQGLTARDAARRAGHSPVAKLLEKEEARGKRLPVNSPVLRAVAGGDLEAVQHFLDAGVSVDSARIMGPALLHVAVIRHRPAMVEFLLSRGADTEITAGEGITPLMAAAQTGARAEAGLLLRYGAKVDARADNGRSALMFAILGNHEAIVEMLLRHGADANVEDAQGMTPLKAARKIDNPHVEQLVLSRGAED
jgi:ankyrin repeat protein